MIEKYFYRIFLLNILRDSKIDLIFANIKRTFKKHLPSRIHTTINQPITKHNRYFSSLDRYHY